MAISEATKLVKQGQASWVVLAVNPEVVKESCRICGGSEDPRSCDNCDGSGLEEHMINIPTYGTDIVFVSSKPADPKEKKVRLNPRLKTPRVATIESKHIERAYVYGNPEAVARIDEYGMLILKEQLRLLAFTMPHPEFELAWREYEETKCPKNFLPVSVRIEPYDDIRKGEGRRYDYGRKI